jgi:hypothetical protein
MPDLKQRFDSLSRTGAPDLWADIRHREPGRTPPDPLGRRVFTVAVALVVAIASVTFVAIAFRTHPLSGPATSPPSPSSTEVHRLRSPSVGPTPTPADSNTAWGFALSCPSRDQAAFPAPKGLRLTPGGSAYIRGNLSGILRDDVIEQMTSTYPQTTPWDGEWRIVRDGSVIAAVNFPRLNGVACRGSGIGGV